MNGGTFLRTSSPKSAALLGCSVYNVPADEGVSTLVIFADQHSVQALLRYRALCSGRRTGSDGLLQNLEHFAVEATVVRFGLALEPAVHVVGNVADGNGGHGSSINMIAK